MYSFIRLEDKVHSLKHQAAATFVILCLLTLPDTSNYVSIHLIFLRFPKLFIIFFYILILIYMQMKLFSNRPNTSVKLSNSINSVKSMSNDDWV